MKSLLATKHSRLFSPLSATNKCIFIARLLLVNISLSGKAC
jgi:hypothetical protein